MKTFLIVLCLFVSNFAFSACPECNIQLKIMDSTMMPIYPDSNITGNPAFNAWLIENKVTKLIRLYPNDTLGELRYKCKLSHKSDAYVLKNALDTLPGVKEVSVLEFWGVSSFSSNHICKVYPNPAHGTLIIEIPPNGKSKYSLRIYSSVGEFVEEIVATNSLTFDIYKYMPGMYLVEIRDERKNTMETHQISIIH